MSEIALIPDCGLRVVSTFAGCGGSSLGYRMAGYRVLWANEWDANARAAYEANKSPETIIDGRDIRDVKPEEILTSCGLKAGELDIFDGSPPCQTFSTAGKRNMQDARSDLFFEYIRLLRGLRPRAFVAENVSGMVKGVAKGQFKEVLQGLRESGYKVSARVLDAQWLGVPQARQRLIFVGLREDVPGEPLHPKPLPYRYSVRDALPWIDEVIQDPKGQYQIQEQDSSVPCFTITTHNAYHVLVAPSRRKADAFQYHDVSLGQPCPTVTTASPGNDLGVPSRKGRRKFTIAELRRICSFPDDFILPGSYSQQWARLGNSVPPLMMRAIAETIKPLLLEPAHV